MGHLARAQEGWGFQSPLSYGWAPQEAQDKSIPSLCPRMESKRLHTDPHQGLSKPTQLYRLLASEAGFQDSSGLLLVQQEEVMTSVAPHSVLLSQAHLHTSERCTGLCGGGMDRHIRTDQLHTTPSCPQASPSLQALLGRIWQEQV
jgi:hypothetical protein